MAQLVETIDQTPDYIQHLRDLVHSHLKLQQRGYIFDQLATSELDKKKRCERCCRVISPKDRPRAAGRGTDSMVLTDTSSITTGPPKTSISDPVRVAGKGDGPCLQPKDTSDSLEPDDSSPKRCKYHPGQVSFKKWTCCNGHPMAPPCHAEKDHVPRAYSVGEIEANWRFFKTPTMIPDKQSPAVAVVIDCEMGVAESGESELIRVSIVDYFTRHVLLDSLVWPEVKMKHYNTRFSGITHRAMQDARRRRACLFGRKNARKAVWRHVGPQTIVVGHAANSDLSSLRWIHPVIIDTLFIEDSILRQEKAKLSETKEDDGQNQAENGTSEQPEEQASSTGSGGVGLSLKALARDRLKREIQIKGRGHDSVEDALATRDLLHWHMTNRAIHP